MYMIYPQTNEEYPQQMSWPFAHGRLFIGRTTVGQRPVHREARLSTRTEEFIREPAQRIARHVRDHARREASHKPAHPVSSPDDLERVQHTPTVTDLRIGRSTSCLQERLCNVERGCEPRSYTAGDASGYDVR